MDQLLYEDDLDNLGRKHKKQEINVTIVVKLVSQAIININLNISPECPFNVFVNGINEEIYSYIMKVGCKKAIKYQLENGSYLQQNDERALSSIGFTNHSTFYIKNKLLFD